MQRGSLLAAIASISIGCAFTDSQLDLRAPDAFARRGPIGAVGPTTFALSDLADERIDRLRVGYKKNQYGVNSADLQTAAPVPELVRDAISAELRANGHGISAAGRFRIEGAVTMAWLDQHPGLDLETVATVACRLRLIDVTTARIVYERRYTGHYAERNLAGTDEQFKHGLKVALERMAQEIAFDWDLAAALRRSLGASGRPG